MNKYTHRIDIRCNDIITFYAYFVLKIIRNFLLLETEIRPQFHFLD